MEEQRRLGWLVESERRKKEDDDVSTGSSANESERVKSKDEERMIKQNRKKKKKQEAFCGVLIEEASDLNPSTTILSSTHEIYDPSMIPEAKEKEQEKTYTKLGRKTEAQEELVCVVFSLIS